VPRDLLLKGEAHDLVRDPARLVLVVRRHHETDVRTAPARGPQLLALARGVLADHRVGRVEHVAGRAIVLLEEDLDAARKALVEVQDVFHLRATPRIDRLIVIADDA